MRNRGMLAAALLAGVVGIGALSMVANPAPKVPAMAATDLAPSAKPYVVKLHARWCPVCMVTRDVWSDVQEAYAGRVRFVVFDFTTEATTAVSRAEAHRLGLEAVFEEYSGVTGSVLVLNGLSREVQHVLHGTRDLTDYQAAIDATAAQNRD